MPVWVIALGGMLIEKLIVPLVRRALINMGLDGLLKNIQKNQETQRAATIQMAKAETMEERDEAIKGLGDSWN